ncbi:MAG: phosphoribosylformylglycinamidine synthase, partial [Oscillospiraceae bacterium]|nr:phosphoribosylformylglycinamidine synthase [Oscillospiraceae bacterium]
TCLGGAIRDPLSGRSYVYQAMRVTGSADPRQKISATLKNRLPQSKITKGAADGFSSYGNQIGLATGGVYEIYHPNYAAKRLEIGAVIGAVPKSNVKRSAPASGDSIILLGGRTGRDGCGGATGSSKSHTSESLYTSGAEVQKGNPLEERKLQRLFRNPKAAAMIKRCNDFGAGGVSVAIGELADSIFIDLSLIPKKYEGLDGTELAISESQERMAVVVASENADAFIYEANLENLEATKVAVVTDDHRLRMAWNGNQILSIDRNFLNSNGAKKRTKIEVPQKNPESVQGISNIIYNKVKNDDIKQAYINLVSDLNICSLKGLAEQFDSSIGAGTVISPFGGAHRLSPSQFMAAKIPVLNGDTDTSSVMSYGFSPYISEISPYMGALYAVVESVSKLIAAGVDLSDIYLSLQEYFPRTQNDPKRFGLPFEALLGALNAQINLGVAAIGGKDSMSGSYSYEDTVKTTGEKIDINIDVPPTLVSFAVGTADAKKIVSNEFKKVSSYVYLLKPYYKKDGTVDFTDLKNLYAYIHKLIEENMILSSYSIGFGGTGEALFKMCMGNSIGFAFDSSILQNELFTSYYGAFIVESPAFLPHGDIIGRTMPQPYIYINNTVLGLNELIYRWLAPLEEIFPTELNKIKDDMQLYIPKAEYYNRPQSIFAGQNPFQPEQSSQANQLNQSTFSIQSYSINQTNPANILNQNENFARPRVLITVFPGTNCEYDTAKQFNMAGGLSDIFVFRNLTPQAITESIDALSQKILNSQILVIPGGFSGGDEPDGSGKFITTIFRNPQITDAVRDLLFTKGGLILGICNGFQVLVKLGLLPYGDIKEVMSPDDPTLSFNRIGRHQSYITYTRTASVNSPWFSNARVGDINAVPVSHGEGRFCVNDEALNNLIRNGQIATQYCDINGNPTMHPYYNPNSSVCAIEGIFSPDGRIFGKMGHNERISGTNIMKNVPGNKEPMFFLSGVRYFK